MGNVILTGFMGSGKSSVAIKLSYRLKKSVIDTDKVIEKKQGKTITQIFEQDGEEVFRQLETDTLRALKASSRNDIISVGGGTPMREENRVLMKETGTVVYLRISPEAAYERLKADNNRPLLKCEDPQSKIRELLEKRGPLYEEGAHIIVDVDGKNFGQILFEIERAVRAREAQERAKRQEANSAQRVYDGERKSDSERRFDGQRRFGNQPTYGGFNGFRRFGDVTAGNTQTDNTHNVSQHAQNIQHALSENAQRQDRWMRKPWLRYETPAADEMPNEMQGKDEEAAAAAEQTEAAQTAAAEVNTEAVQTAAAEVNTEAETISVEEAAEPAANRKRPKRLLVINGPNINFLGIREKGVYGTQDYQYLLNLIAQKGIDCGVAIEVYQSNHEGAIIDRIQASYFDGTEGLIINPGAYTHYSYAIRDALASIEVPKVEVHISNIMEREEFRRVSVTAPVCDKQIYGQGLDGYLQAVDFILTVQS